MEPIITGNGTSDREGYGSKIWHSNDKYRRVVWRCNGKYEKQTGCSTPHLLEDDFKRLFLKALSRLQDKRELLIADCEAFISELAYTDDIDRKAERIRSEQATVEGLVANLIQENATVKLDQTVYNSRLEEYTTRFDSLGERLNKLEEKKNRLKQQADIISRFIQDLKTLEEMPVDFSPNLWNAFVEKLTIYPDGRAEFLFKNGAVITETI